MTNLHRTIIVIPKCLRNNTYIFIAALCIYSSVPQMPSLLQGIGWQSKSCPENAKTYQNPPADSDIMTSTTPGTHQHIHQPGFFGSF